MIDLTPLEVRKKKGDFRRALRGYEPALVDDFLDLAADRIEQLAREHAAAAERLRELEQRVREYRDRERALTDALVTAQEMREEIRAQTAREAELALRTSSQEAETRVRDAEQRADTLLRDAEQRSETLVREAELRAQTMLRDAEQRSQQLVRDSEQHAATTVRAAEQGAEDTLRRAQQEADAELAGARQEAERLRSELVQVREREEAALLRLRQQQRQQLSSYRNFLERELAELDIVTAGLVSEEPEEPPPGGDAGQPAPPTRDSRAAAAAAVLAQSFLVDDGDEAGEAPFQDPEAELEPFEPEPVYEEDLEPRELRVEPGELLAEPEAEPQPDGSGDGEDTDTAVLLQNAELAGYHLDLDLADDAPAGEEPELLLEEPADGESRNDDDDWLSSMIEETR